MWTRLYTDRINSCASSYIRIPSIPTPIPVLLLDFNQQLYLRWWRFMYARHTDIRCCKYAVFRLPSTVIRKELFLLMDVYFGTIEVLRKHHYSPAPWWDRYFNFILIWPYKTEHHSKHLRKLNQIVHNVFIIDFLFSLETRPLNLIWYNFSPYLSVHFLFEKKLQNVYTFMFITASAHSIWF